MFHSQGFTLKVTEYSEKLSLQYTVTTKSCNASLFQIPMNLATDNILINQVIFSNSGSF